MKYDKICIMLPTYKRHGTYLPKFINTAIEMASDPKNICFSFCVNRDDTGTQCYLEELFHKKYRRVDYEIIIETLQKPNLAIYFNMMYNRTKFKDDSIIVSQFGDDMEFRTKGWDTKFIELINSYDGIGVFWANDDYIAGYRCPVNLLVTRKMIGATGLPFMCELFTADMIDWIWGKIGKYTRTSHYLPDVHIFHNHNSGKPKEEWDETFKRLRPEQDAARVIGKQTAKEVAVKAADNLKSKGFIGDSVC